MNIFIVGWNLPPGLIKNKEKAINGALAELYKTYPQLEKSAEVRMHESNYFMVSLQHHPSITHRRYVSAEKREIVLYSGAMIDQEGQFNATDATELGENWNRLASSMEGAYVVLKITGEPKRLELMTDFLGLEPVYYSKVGSSTYISNNVFLLRQVSGFNSPDPIGLSMFLAIQYPIENRTFVEGISVIPGGKYICWEGDQVPIKETSHFVITDYLDKRKYSKADTNYLQTSLLETCSNLSKIYPDILCPLTGGRDSRLIASLLKTAGIKAKYYTYGGEKSDDIRIAKQIAQIFDLDYEYQPIYQEDIVREWETICERLIRQNDGMVCLWQMQDVLLQEESPASLPVIPAGFFAGIARGFISQPEYYIHGSDIEFAQSFLFNKLSMPDEGLLKQEAVDQNRKEFYSFCAKTVDMGFEPVDIMHVFYMLNYTPQWSGINYRKYKPNGDIFSPLATRAYADTAFLLPARERYVEPLHYKLINRMAPELKTVPFTQGGWNIQNADIFFARHFLRWPLRKIKQVIKQRNPELFKDHKIKTFNQHGWFEEQIDKIRPICLDHQNGSLLWNIIDRTKLEKMLSSETDPQKRGECIEFLYNIFTIAYYFSINDY